MVSYEDIPFRLSAHARIVVAERGIRAEWILRVLNRPERVEDDAQDPDLRHALGVIDEHAGRVLRIVYNHREDPWRIVTALLRSPGKEQDMKIHFDEQADAVYLRLDDSPIADSEEVKPGIVLDFDDRGQVVAIEILRISRRVPRARLKQMQFEVA